MLECDMATQTRQRNFYFNFINPNNGGTEQYSRLKK